MNHAFSRLKHTHTHTYTHTHTHNIGVAVSRSEGRSFGLSNVLVSGRKEKDEQLTLRTKTHR